ncbi:MAG: histidine kinase dimerization/phospho-acceptor domain-containing protein [bacterium]
MHASPKSPHLTESREWSKHRAYFSDLCQAINSKSEIEDICLEIHQHIQHILRVDVFKCALLDEHSGVAAWVYGAGQTDLSNVAPSLTADDWFREAAASRDMICKEQKYGQEIICPMICDNRVLGAIVIEAHRPGSWAEQELALLAIIASYLALVLHHHSLVVELENVQQEQVQFEEIVRKNKKLLSIIELARSIAHELNQPLTGISGYCTLIKEQISADHEIVRDIDEIQRQAERLEELVYRFQNVAHVEYSENQRKSPPF